MGNVVSIFHKKKKVTEPSNDVEGYLKSSLQTAAFEVLSEFKKVWDPKANLWRLEILVQQALRPPKQMAFWYDGDEPQYAEETRPGQEFDYRTADRIVKVHENR